VYVYMYMCIYIYMCVYVCVVQLQKVILELHYINSIIKYHCKTPWSDFKKKWLGFFKTSCVISTPCEWGLWSPRSGNTRRSRCTTSYASRPPFLDISPMAQNGGFLSHGGYPHPSHGWPWLSIETLSPILENPHMCVCVCIYIYTWLSETHGFGGPEF